MNEDLANIRRIEEQLLQTMHKHGALILTNLVAIFTQRDTQHCLAIFNTVNPPSIQDFSEIMSLEQLLLDKRDLMEDYDGTVITFRSLGLVRSDIITRGSGFYPMGQFYRRVNQIENLPQTQLNLSKALFSILHANGELEEKIPEHSLSTWLKKMSRLFKLSLPSLLERHQVEGLVAILPDENFKNYLDQQSYTLIYATEGANEVASENVNLFDLEYFMKVPVTTMTRLCAAFTEVRLFN